MGIYEQAYCYSSDTPIHGVGQGLNASPAFWLLISSILFDFYQQQANGMTNVQSHRYSYYETMARSNFG